MLRVNAQVVNYLHPTYKKMFDEAVASGADEDLTLTLLEELYGDLIYDVPSREDSRQDRQ